ncbi:hypothetical protein F4802DRAFT_618720 [Xylaria palmicola]|nr:hypothetical protein F4802DRAFT_618720 [Xylaria palmicola]
MISPRIRRVAGRHIRVSRSAAAAAAPLAVRSSYLANLAGPSIANFQSHQSPAQSTTPPLQTVRMSSSNAANKNFTRDHLFDCKGRVALVTGGGSGIGLMITQALVANGARVYITGRTGEKLARVAATYSEGADSIVPIASDITSKAGIRKLVGEIERRDESGRGLHILVNNAGIVGATLETDAGGDAAAARENLFTDDEASTFDDWTDVYRTNVAQLFFTTTAFLPLLQRASEAEHGWSSAVVNVTSISAHVKSAQHHFQYNASKAAAAHLTRMLANEVSVTNGLRVRVNALAPGVFPSEMTAGGGESGRDQKSSLPADKYRGKIPANRPGRDEDMAQAALALVCNQYIGGQTLVVDGGYTVAMGE